MSNDLLNDDATGFRCGSIACNGCGNCGQKQQQQPYQPNQDAIRRQAQAQSDHVPWHRTRDGVMAAVAQFEHDLTITPELEASFRKFFSEMPPTIGPGTCDPKVDGHHVVNKPSHYMLFPDTEVMDVIRNTLSYEEFVGYLKGNVLKYRLRAGKKDNAEQDLAKAARYEHLVRTLIDEGELFEPLSLEEQAIEAARRG